MEVVTDSFDRADSAVSLGTSDSDHAWTAHSGTWGISSNAGYRAADAGGNNDCATVDSAVDDCTVVVTASVVADEWRMCARLTDFNNTLVVQCAAGTWTLYRKEGGVFNSIGSWAGTQTNGDIGQLRLSGASVVFVHNGTDRITATEAFNATATRHGLAAGNGGLTGRWEDFSVTVP